MDNPKTTPAFAAGTHGDLQPGLSQYAFVAMTFHAGILAGREPRANALRLSDEAASVAFDHADAFFAELAKRTQS